MGIGDFFKALVAPFIAVLSFAAFSALGPLGAPFWGTAFSWGSALVFGSTILLSAFAGRRPNLDLPDIVSSTYGSNEPAKTIYGEAVVGGLIVNIREEDPAGYDIEGGLLPPFYVTYVICEMKEGFTYEVEDIEIGGDWLQTLPAVPLKGYPGPRDGANNGATLSTTNGKYLEIPTSSDYKLQLDCRVRYGYSDLATNQAMFLDDATMKGEGLVIATLRFSRSVNPDHSSGGSRVFWTNKRVRFENVRFAVLATPTVKSTGTVISPSDVLKLHLKNEMGVSDDRIDSASFAAAATAAGVQHRNCNGFFRSGQEYEAIGWILQAMGGTLVQDGGKFFLKGLDDPSPTMTIIDEMLLEPPEIQHTVPWRNRYNTIRGEIIDRNANWTRQSTREYRDHTGYAADGNVNYLLDVGGMAFVNLRSQAQSLLIEELARRRVAETIIVQVHYSDIESANIKAYDMVNVRLAANGINAKFRIQGIIHSVEGNVSMTLVSEQNVQTSVDGILSNVPNISGLSGISNGYSSITLSWDDDDDPQITGSERRYKESSSSSWGNWISTEVGDATTCSITGLDASTSYNCQVRWVIGARAGDPSSTVTVITKARLPAPTNVRVVSSRTTTSSFRVAWDAVTGAETYDYQRKLSSESWGTVWMRLLGRSSSQILPIVTYATFQGLSSSTTYNVRVRAVDLDDNSASLPSPSVTATTSSSGGPVDPDPPTPPPQPPNPPVGQKPGAVRSLNHTYYSAGGRGPDRLVIAWSTPSSGGSVSSYEWRSSSTTTWTSTTSTRLTLTGSGHTGKTYYVRARNSVGVGPTSSTYVRITGAPPGPGL